MELIHEMNKKMKSIGRARRGEKLLEKRVDKKRWIMERDAMDGGK